MFLEINRNFHGHYMHAQSLYPCARGWGVGGFINNVTS
jgi:hypothetical protein